MDYEYGLAVLHKYILGLDIESDFLVYQTSLQENIDDERKYGSSEQSRRDRYRIIDSLNRFCIKNVGKTFNDLCVKNTLDVLPSKGDKKTTILFISSDPSDISRLRLDQEVRDIQDALMRSKNRDNFYIDQRMSTTASSISRILLDVQPKLVHFSGHGSIEGKLCFEDETGKMKQVSPEALKYLFEMFSDRIECILLNACYSLIQANAIAEHIKYVIGMNKPIGDMAAINFAVGFYEAIISGSDVPNAYKFGIAQLKILDIPEDDTPELICRS